MMTFDDHLQLIRQQGHADALALREAAPTMTGTEIIAAEDKIPPWDNTKDYTGWSPGGPVADEGQVWTLLQPHNAAHYTGRPSGLRSLWGLVHTTDPDRAKPWVAPHGVSGLYMFEECCTYPMPDGTVHVFRNLHDKNQYPPFTQTVEHWWQDLGEVIA